MRFQNTQITKTLEPGSSEAGSVEKELTAAQREVVSHKDGPMCVIAVEKKDVDGILAVHRIYQELYRKEKFISYDDQISMINELFEEKPYIRKKYQKKYRYVMVNEFQDISEDQVQMVYTSTTGITVFVLVFPPLDEDDKYCILPYFWIPEETLELRVRRDHVPYDIWQRQGFLQTTEGNVMVRLPRLWGLTVPSGAEMTQVLRSMMTGAFCLSEGRKKTSL